MVMDVLMIGAGEYTTGHVPTKGGAASDKPAGVVAITLFDLRRSGKVGRMVLCDAGGGRFPAIRDTLRIKIAKAYADMDIQLETFPADDIAHEPQAYLAAMDSMKRGDMVTVFTPDNLHFDIAMAAVRRGLHVLLAKPAVKTLSQHLELCRHAEEAGVLVAVEFHKRFDPVYQDARDRVRALGPFSFFSSTMSQGKRQLDTFASWAGRSSDISYYLNSHHIDFHQWAVGAASRPERCVAMAAHGVADARLAGGVRTEDTITLLTQWGNSDGTKGTAAYTASWIAPPSDCHTQQYFHYMGHKGELRVDQAHRGFTMATDEAGFATLNPLYMKYTPDSSGRFAGQGGYGYRSIAEFVTAAELVNGGKPCSDFDKEGMLATISTTLLSTAILEAGRRSLDEGGRPVVIEYDSNGLPCQLISQ